MYGRSVRFNQAVLLIACGLLTADGASDAVDAANDPRCSPSLSVVLDLENDVGGMASRPLENNGSFFYVGIDYPPELRWTDGNVTYGCICKVRNCIRKCCRNDEVLRKKSEGKGEAICQKMPQNRTESTKVEETPDLRLSAKDQMTDEIKHIDKLKEHFLLVQDNECPGKAWFDLNPDEDKNDKIILQANGSFVDTDGKSYPFWNYCIDWKLTVDRIGILVCYTSELQSTLSDQEEYVHHHVGIIVSIPFLVATFLVYAITPELRNLYGKTFMCYVMCLIIAYVFLILVNYIYMSPIRALCITTGK